MALAISYFYHYFLSINLYYGKKNRKAFKINVK